MTKFDYAMVHEDKVIERNNLGWVMDAYENGDIFAKDGQCFVFTNGEYKKAYKGDLILFEDGKLAIIKPDSIFKVFGKVTEDDESSEENEEVPAYFVKADKKFNREDIFNIVYLEKDGQYTSVDDTTWFEEEIKKGDRIHYNENVGSYTVTGPSFNKIAGPGDLIVRYIDTFFVMNGWTIITYLLMFYKNDLFKAEKEA